MQTLSGSYEQKQPLSLQLASTSVDHSTVVTPSTFISSFTSEGISSTTHSGIASSCGIRPSTPEITYPYPLYKSEHYYHRRRMMKTNQVGMVYLHGVRIVSLGMEGKERLCLAQISNTLLKNYSYNEIHNRRVALGITCVQCTPVQLEILRRAGAMPISSRRCGMITKREAERLCKSFLGDNSPPKLPDNFAFEVYHECAWGCRGQFVPSRYNSSRAKCIKCSFCAVFFSPNKFVFHSHRLLTETDKYIQPDAANFNSWRRHTKLLGDPPEEVSFAWEDVKAMFNGGTRKRMLAAAIGNSHQRVNTENSHHHNNRIKYHDQSSMQQETNTPPCPSLPHNAAAAAAAAAVAGRATLAAARAACAAACVVQASATSSGKDGTAEKGYGELYEVSNHSQRNKVLRMENSGPELHEPNYAPNDKNTGCEDTSIPSRTPPIAKIGASNLKEYPLQNIRDTVNNTFERMNKKRDNNIKITDVMQPHVEEGKTMCFDSAKNG